MEVIPVINCETRECVNQRIEEVKKLNSEWVKFDISDGEFNPVLSWNSPNSLSEDQKSFLNNISLEVHLMVSKPGSEVEKWLKFGADRVILHVESNFDLDSILEKCRENGAGLMISKNPDTSLDRFDPYFDKVNYFQFLAVTPGYSGQSMNPRILEEIKALRQLKPDVKIEVDGGINEKTAKEVKEAGADIVVSSSYIFKSDNPKEAFEKLKSI